MAPVRPWFGTVAKAMAVDVRVDFLGCQLPARRESQGDQEVIPAQGGRRGCTLVHLCYLPRRGLLRTRQVVLSFEFQQPSRVIASSNRVKVSVIASRCHEHWRCSLGSACACFVPSAPMTNDLLPVSRRCGSRI